MADGADKQDPYRESGLLDLLAALLVDALDEPAGEAQEEAAEQLRQLPPATG